MNNLRKWLVIVWAALTVTTAAAAEYPTKPIRLIAPYPSGGGIDTVARLVAERLAPRLGQPVVVDNKPGAAATIGADALIRSPADGYTIMLGSIVDYSISPYSQKGINFDMSRDFAPIVEIGFGTVGMVVSADLPAKSVSQLIALATAKPNQISFASAGTGSMQHLQGEMFKQMTGVEMVHVPYKGTTQFLPDLIAGRVQMTIDSMPAHLPYIKSGKLRALAVASKQRSPMLPDVPTMAEAGLPGFDVSTNYTLFAPAGTPRDVIARLNKETNEVLPQQDLRDRLLALGIIVSGGTSEAVRGRITVEMSRWAGVIKAANIKLD